MRHYVLGLLLAATFGASAADKTDFLPPWNPPPAGLQFSVPPVDAIADLHGDIVDPQLVVFFAGNQFMVVHDLLEAFKQAHPQYQRIYAETLPPGILAKQIESGTLVMGNLRITLKPDIYTAGKDAIADNQQKHGWFADSYDYARREVMIPMRDGVKLHTIILIPKGAAHAGMLVRSSPALLGGCCTAAVVATPISELQVFSASTPVRST